MAWRIIAPIPSSAIMSAGAFGQDAPVGPKICLEIDDPQKEEILSTRIDASRVMFVVDDCPRVIEMWRRNGLNVFPVNQDRWEGGV